MVQRFLEEEFVETAGWTQSFIYRNAQAHRQDRELSHPRSSMELGYVAGCNCASTSPPLEILNSRILPDRAPICCNEPVAFQ